jgi:MFS family permease
MFQTRVYVQTHIFMRRTLSKGHIFAGWWQVAIGMLTQAAATGTIVTCFSVIAAPIAKEFGTSRGRLGLVMTLTFLIGGLINPLLGTAMDRFSIRKIMLAGGASLAAGYLALSFTVSMTGVAVAYGLLLAPASAALGPLSYSTLIPRWFVARRARALGITVAGYAIGGLFLPPLFALMIDSFGWRNAVRSFAGFVLLVLIPLIAWLVIDRPSDVDLNPDGGVVPQRADPSVAAEPQQSNRTLLGERNFWVITICIWVVLLGSGGLLSNMVPFALSRGFSATQGALFLSSFSAGSLTSKVLYSFFGDRLNPRAGLTLGILFFISSSVCFLLGATYPVLLAASYLFGMGVGTSLPLWSYLTARVFGTANVGRVFGLMNIVTMPFALLAPPGMGAIFDHTHAYDDGFILYICLGLAALLLVPKLRIAATHRLVPAPVGKHNVL